MLDALKKGVSVLALVSLISCGGGSGELPTNYLMGVPTKPASSDTTTGSDTANTDNAPEAIDNRIASLEVAASSRQIGSNGSDAVTISAIVKDINNNILKDAEVQFAVNNSGTIEPDENSADSSVKTAKLTPGLNRPENRTMLVTVTAGNQRQTLEVDVTGTLMQLDGPARVVAGVPTEFVAKLKDSTGAGLPHQVVTIQSSGGSTINATGASGYQTDNNGEVKFTVTALSSGTDMLTASALGADYQHEISISGDEFTLSSNNAEINVNTPETITLLWKFNGNPQAYKQIDLSATRGSVPGSVKTDGNGRATFTLSSSQAGGTVVTAIDAASGLTASVAREFVAVIPKYMSVQAESSSIGPEEKTTIFALVRDVNDNPVKNQKVTFNLYDSVNGALSASIATTDSLGRASVVYTSGNATSAKDGVVIEATLQNDSAISSQVKLTVGKRALRIVLGADEKLAESGVFYQKSYGVIVTDSAGNPVPDKAVSFTVIPTHYHKGYMVCGGDGWVPQYSEYDCASEDLDYDGWLDEGEDLNGNGRLEPTNTATVSTNVTTDEEGKATVQVSFQQSQAQWSRVKLVAKISDGGSEYYESTTFNLPVLSSDVNNCDQSPPNPTSPYGVLASCQVPKQSVKY